MSLIGEIVHFFRDQADVDANTRRPMRVHRQELDAGVVYLHGELPLLRGAQYARVVGDPYLTGSDQDGIPRAALVDTPTAGCATLRPAVQGLITDHPAPGSFVAYALSANVWQTVTGGTLAPTNEMVSYDPNTGVVSVERSGNYYVSVSVSVEWTVGLLAPRFQAGIWRSGVLTPLSGRVRFLGVSDGRCVAFAGPIGIARTETIELRIRANQAVTVELSDFSLALKRGQA